MIIVLKNILHEKINIKLIINEEFIAMCITEKQYILYNYLKITTIDVTWQYS